MGPSSRCSQQRMHNLVIGHEKEILVSTCWLRVTKTCNSCTVLLGGRDLHTIVESSGMPSPGQTVYEFPPVSYTSFLYSLFLL
ncbi:hypothetical protein LINPERHAP1_LOCUS14719 [Linum perenne]